MRPWAARLITYGVSGGLAALAIAFMRPLPERRPVADVAGLAASWEERVDSIASGETLGKVLERGGVSGQHMQRALHAMASTKTPSPTSSQTTVSFSRNRTGWMTMPRGSV